MPDEKPLPKTQEIVAPSAEEIFRAEMRAGIKDMRAEVAELKETFTHGLGLVTDEVNAVKVDVAEFKGETREKFKNHSIPIREGSSTDMRHSADIAALKSAIDANTGLTQDIKQIVVDAGKSPVVRTWAGRIVGALGVLAMAYLGYAQMLVAQKQAAIQASVDRQPSVIVVPVFDGGTDAHP